MVLFIRGCPENEFGSKVHSMYTVYSTHIQYIDKKKDKNYVNNNLNHSFGINWSHHFVFGDMTLFAEQFIHVLLNWKCWLVPYKDQSICILHPYESICHVGDKITSMKLQNVSHYAHMVAMCFWNIWWLHNFIIKNRLWILKRSIWRTIFGFLERKQSKAPQQT